MPVSKVNGESFGATVTFHHRGTGGDFDVGIGIKYTPTPTWAYATVTLPNDPDWTPYSVDVSGVWNTDLPHCRLVDVLKFIQVAGGPRDIGGQGFELADWDRDVYHSVLESEFINLQGTYW